MLHRTFRDGSDMTTPVRETRSRLGRRFDPVDGSAVGDHWVIAPDGNLLLRDGEGTIMTARRVDGCGGAAGRSSANPDPEPAPQSADAVSRRMIRTPELARIADAVDRENTRCDLLSQSAAMVGMMEAVADYQPAAYTDRPGAAYASWPPPPTS